METMTRLKYVNGFRPGGMRWRTLAMPSESRRTSGNAHRHHSSCCTWSRMWRGTTANTRFARPRRCSSDRSIPTSMVLPRPTASATRRRGWSWVVESRKGSRWKGRSSASISCPTVRSVLETGTGVRRMMLSRTRRVSIPLAEVSGRNEVRLGSSGSMRSMSEKKDARRSRINSSRPMHRTTARAPMACRSISVTCQVWSRTITREPAAIMSSSSMLVAGSTGADPLQCRLVGCLSAVIARKRPAGRPPPLSTMNRPPPQMSLTLQTVPCPCAAPRTHQQHPSHLRGVRGSLASRVVRSSLMPGGSPPCGDDRGAGVGRDGERPGIWGAQVVAGRPTRWPWHRERPGGAAGARRWDLRGHHRRRARATMRDSSEERPGDLVNRDFAARSSNRCDC